MMEKSEAKVITGSICLILSFFVIFLYIDGNQSNSNLFGNFSYSFSHFLGNSLGSFVILFCSIPILIGFFILMNISLEMKLFTTGGYSLLALLFPAFFETFHIGGLTGGYFGRSIAALFQGGGIIIAGIAYFFWFSLASCILLFPFRNYIVEALLSALTRLNLIDYTRETSSSGESKSGGFINNLFNSNSEAQTPDNPVKTKKQKTLAEQRTFKQSDLGRSESGSDKRKRTSYQDDSGIFDKIFAFFNSPRPTKREQRNQGRKVIKSKSGSPPPWLSKVKYITPENRIEIPILASEEDKKIRKFKLQTKQPSEDKDPNGYEEYEEVDTFSQKKSSNKVYEEIDKRKEDYFDKVKEEWPDKWKKNMDGYQDNIQHLPYKPELKTPPPVREFEDLEEDDFEEYVENRHKKEDILIVDEQSINNEKIINSGRANSESAKGKILNRENIIEARVVRENEQEHHMEPEINNNFQELRELEELLKQKHGDLSAQKSDAITTGTNSAHLYDDRFLDDIDELDELDELEDLDEEESIQQHDSYPISENQGSDYSLPDHDILNEKTKNSNKDKFLEEEREDAEILEKTLSEFGIKAQVMDIIHGPVVTLFKIEPAPGIKLSKIEGLSNNLALRLAAKSIRIIAPIPGEKVVGIEIPNKTRELITFREIVNSEEFVESTSHIPIGLGKDIYGNTITIDLMRMPHILIAGATGAGKSVCVNGFLSSMLFAKKPDELRMILIDPKIVELKPYNGIPHLLTPVITDSKQAITALKYLVFEMERRYSLLDQIGVRDIVEYNATVKKKRLQIENLPFIVCVVDEFADLMSTAGKDTEMLFARLTAKARAIGIHLVLATQRPSTDVITGLIKANVPARIAFQVISLQDSRIILDQKGAEKLLGQGDMLYLSPTQPFPIRLQGAFLSKEEVDSIAEHWKSIADAEYIDINEILGEAAGEDDDLFDGEHSSKDPLFDEAVQIVYHTKKASASYLQRRLNIGYNRAARLIEEMEEMGIVGPPNGSKPREVLMEGYDAPM